MPIAVKICGLTEPKTLDAAIGAGADFVGFVFFPPSPRALEAEDAAMLAARTPETVTRVGLFVDPDDSLLDRITEAVDLDVIQLHGGETPERVAAIKGRTGLRAIKVIKVADAADIALADRYEPVADYLMFDAKPPKDATRPGGNAAAFDWTLLAGQKWRKPWFLAGGLTADNVANAIRITGTQLVDTSSGVEDSPGRKSAAKVKAFVDALAPFR